jgi:transposase
LTTGWQQRIEHCAERARMYQPAKSHDYSVNTCHGCLEKQREIDRLREEVQRLREKLCQRQRQAAAGPFASATPSSKVPVKANTAPEQTKKQGGARPGHPGHGRTAAAAAEATRVVALAVASDHCPECGTGLTEKGWRERTVWDCQPVVVERLLYRLQKKHCPRCRRTLQAQAPGVLPKSLFGNQLTAHILTSHYLHGEPLGRISDRLGLNVGSLLEMAHRVGYLFRGVVKHLSDEYRQAAVRHADETTWRTDGQSGYAWLFSTDNLSIFLFRRSRAAHVAKEVLGDEPLSGVLVVDRYHAYNKAPCALQYCYAHLMRDVEDLQKEFARDAEVQCFTAALIPLLAQAMHLRAQAISDRQYYRQARKLQAQIIDLVEAEARHPGVRRMQDLFHEKAERLYHWVESRAVPAENNRAERELRPTVIARKVSFGSQSEAGAKTREILLSLLATLKKRGGQPAQKLKAVLDQLAINPRQDALAVLWRTDTS